MKYIDLNNQISEHKNNIRDWFVEPENWGNNQRLTYQEVAQRIAKDKDLIFKKEYITLEKTKTIYVVYLNNKVLRSFPKSVYNLVKYLKKKK